MDNTTTPISYTINPPKQYGWVCPLCGRANAPWVSQCPCKPDSTNPDLLKAIARTWNEVYG